MGDHKLHSSLAEVPHIPAGRDLSFYLVLFLVVGPVWSIIPLSWLFVVYALHYGLLWTFAWKGWTLFAFALAEVFFSVYYLNLARFVAGPSPNGPGDLRELRAVFHRVLQSGLANLPEEGFDEETLDVDRPGSPEEAITQLEFDDPRAVDFRNYLRTWFGKAPWSSIHKHEMYTWLYWSIFNAHFPGIDKVSEHERTALLDVIGLIEHRSGCKIPDGSNPAVSTLRLTLDPVNVSWRPFLWYAAVAISNAVIRRRLQTDWRAKVRTYKDLEYVIRVPPKWDPSSRVRPVVFMHGLGLGLTQYYRFIRHIFRALPDHPILVPLHPHVSQEIMHPRFLRPMGRREMAEHLAELLDELGWAHLENASRSDSSDSDDGNAVRVARVRKGVTMVSHSNGSFSHAWLLKTHPQMITRSCFVDPVTFCSWEGDLCYNFIYRPAENGFHLVVKYFVGTELGVANFLQRHFDWSSNSLWFDEIPKARDPQKTLFVLGGRDAIIDSHRVKRYLTSHGIRKGLHFDPNGHHGEALLSSSPFHHEIVRWMQAN